MKENGAMGSHRARESFIMWMETSMKDSGQTTRPTEEVYTSTQKEQGMKVNGRMISNTARESRFGTRDPNMMDNMSKGRKKVEDFTPGLMAPLTKENGLTTRSLGKEFTSGKTEGGSMESGKITIWKATEFTTGPMADVMRDSITTIRNAVTVCITGQTAVSMKAGGTKVSNTVSGPTWIQRKTRSSLVSGRTASALLGSTSRRSSLSLNTLLTLQPSSRSQNRQTASSPTVPSVSHQILT